MPERIQRRRAKGWRMPAGAVNVCRPTKWGNPFGIDHWEWRMPDSPYWSCVVVATHQVVARFDTREEAVAKAVEMHRAMMPLRGQAWLDFLHRWGIPEEATTTSVGFLRGKDLACWCPVGSPCHADTLIELANREG